MEYTMVTVRTEDNAWEADLELPARMKLKTLAIKVLDTVKALDDRFAGTSRIRFLYGGTALNEEASLADYGIWDGSILFIRC